MWHALDGQITRQDCLLPENSVERRPAPEGEPRWADISDVGGRTLCAFWAKGGRVVRHECIVPSRSY